MCLLQNPRGALRKALKNRAENVYSHFAEKTGLAPSNELFTLTLAAGGGWRQLLSTAAWGEGVGRPPGPRWQSKQPHRQLRTRPGYRGLLVAPDSLPSLPSRGGSVHTHRTRAASVTCFDQKNSADGQTWPCASVGLKLPTALSLQPCSLTARTTVKTPRLDPWETRGHVEGAAPVSQPSRSPPDQPQSHCPAS